MATVLWYAPQAVVTINNTALTAVGTTSTLLSQATGGLTVTTFCKDLKISLGSRDYSAVNVLGTSQLGQQGRPDVIEASLTLVYQDADTMTGFGGAGTTITIGTTTVTYKRYQGGEKASGDRAASAFLFSITDGTSTVNCLLNNAYTTSRDISLAADGHVEETITVKCLAQNYYEEDNLSD
jgi:hypothetical protein